MLISDVTALSCKHFWGTFPCFGDLPKSLTFSDFAWPDFYRQVRSSRRNKKSRAEMGMGLPNWGQARRKIVGPARAEESQKPLNRKVFLIKPRATRWKDKDTFCALASQLLPTNRKPWCSNSWPASIAKCLSAACFLSVSRSKNYAGPEPGPKIWAPFPSLIPGHRKHRTLPSRLAKMLPTERNKNCLILRLSFRQSVVNF